jgi:ascorbate-specific PTS system EIIC-type component UlaA
MSVTEHRYWTADWLLVAVPLLVVVAYYPEWEAALFIMVALFGLVMVVSRALDREERDRRGEA